MKTGRVEGDTADTLLVERVRRDLHRDRRDAGVPHPREQSVEVGRLGGGPREQDRLPGHVRADRADRHRCGDPAARNTASRRWTTVVLPFVPVTPTIVIERAGSPNTTADIGPIARRTEGTRTCGTIDLEPPLDHERRRARSDRLRCEVVPVRASSHHAEEQGILDDLT